MKEIHPICLNCKNLIWNGFWAHCINILIDDSLFSEVMELTEAKRDSGTENELVVKEQQQEIRFEKSLANQLLTIPYIVWKRKNITKYYEHAPKTINECPFRYEPKTVKNDVFVKGV